MVVVLIFKAVVMGVYMFVSYDFDRCNELLMEFSICYFFGVCVYCWEMFGGVGSRVCGRVEEVLEGEGEKG